MYRYPSRSARARLTVVLPAPAGPSIVINNFFGISFPLPLEFDIDKLNADLEKAETFEFSTHPLKYHDGTWTAINLIYGGGGTHYTHEGDLGYGTGEPEPTEVLKACPYFAEVLEQFPGKIKMARLSALPPGGRIRRHYDPVESADFDQLRIITTPEPGTIALFGLGLFGLGALGYSRYRRRNRR